VIRKCPLKDLKHYLLADAGILNFESKKEFPISKMDQK
jgi:hypothetical protein